MKLSDLRKAESLAAQRRDTLELLKQILGTKDCVTVTLKLSRWSVDQSMTDAARSAIVANLRDRIAESEKQLAAYGVEIDD